MTRGDRHGARDRTADHRVELDGGRLTGGHEDRGVHRPRDHVESRRVVPGYQVRRAGRVVQLQRVVVRHEPAEREGPTGVQRHTEVGVRVAREGTQLHARHRVRVRGHDLSVDRPGAGQGLRGRRGKTSPTENGDQACGDQSAPDSSRHVTVLPFDRSAVAGPAHAGWRAGWGRPDTERVRGAPSLAVMPSRRCPLFR